MAGIQTTWDGRYNLSDLPLWRKIAIGLALGLSFVIGGTTFSKESDIYVDAPGAPKAATRQVSPVHVNHGYLRYVTPESAKDLAFWEQTMVPAIGALFLVVGALLLTGRAKS